MTDESKQQEKILNLQDILDDKTPIDTDFDPKNFNVQFLTSILTEENYYVDELFSKEATNDAHAHFHEMISSMQDNPLSDNDPESNIASYFNNPIDFIDFMETVYIKQQLESNENIFQLKNHNYPKNRLNALQYIPKPVLSSKIFKGKNVITSIAVNGEMLFTGNNLGTIRKYSCKNEFEYEAFANAEIEANNKRSVVCMDISEERQFLISGYLNGYLALWDIPTAKCKKIVKNVHMDSVVACCFMKTENKTYTIISSDLQGYVYETIISEGYFTTKVDYVQLMKINIPVFLIEILKYSKEEKKQYSFCSSQALIVAFGSLENLLIYQLEPEQKSLFIFERPDVNNIYIIPDVAFGIGYAPQSNTSSSSMIDLKKNGVSNYNQPQTLLSISWNDKIYVYIIPITPDGALPLIQVGLYCNPVPILRMGFISNSIVYFYDKNKHVKVINTALLPYTNSLIENHERTNQHVIAELEDGTSHEINSLFQTYIPNIIYGDDTSSSSKYKATYNRYILSQSNNVVILSKDQLYYGKLLNWEQCLNNLQQNSECIKAMSMGLDLYHGRLRSLPEIPIKDSERREKVSNILKGLIIQYALIHSTFEPSPTLNKTEDELTKCINICIEFCIEMKNIDLLMTELQPMFDSKNYGEIFIEKLEPFILCDKIGNQQLGNLTIAKIMEIYMKKNNYQILSQILIHLDIKTIDVDNKKKLCSEKHLITPLIYIYMNDSEEDYFFPVKRIYEIFVNATNVPLKEFVSYASYLKHIGMALLEQSKPYIGHKLLWYINLCFNGEKFPSNYPIEESKHQLLIMKIVLWLLSQSVFDILIRFDSASLFSLFTRLFYEERLSGFISQWEYDKKTIEDYCISIKGKLIERIDKETLCEVIIEKAREIHNEYIWEDLYYFIIKITPRMGKDIKKEIILKAIVYLLSCQKRGDLEDVEDFFGAHKHPLDLPSLSILLIKVIDIRGEEFLGEEMENLLIKSSGSPFVNFTIHLMNKIGKYSECLEFYIKEPSIENKPNRLFDWLEETLTILINSNQKESDKLKLAIIERIPQLAEVSIERLSSLITVWFKANHNQIIEKLKGYDQLQLLYVNKNLETYKEEEIRPDDIGNYENLLLIHMNLLFKLNKKDAILFYLQKRQLYPTEIILEKCKKEKVYDAALFLFKKVGAVEEAMEYFSNALISTFDIIMEAILHNKLHDELSLQLAQNRDRCIEICEINSEKSRNDDSEQMWFKLLQLFYNMLTKIKTKQQSDTRLLFSFEHLTFAISQNIKEIFEKMDSYVRIQSIIENVNNNFKQAEFKEFKNLLSTVFSSYTHITNLMSCVTNLLEISLSNKFNEYQSIIAKGTNYVLDKCDDCQEEFDMFWREEVIVFKCGHKVHDKCAYVYRDTAILCPACRNQQTAKESRMVTTRENDLNDHMINAITHQKRKVIICEEAKKKQTIELEELKNFDKKYFETTDLFNLD